VRRNYGTLLTVSILFGLGYGLYEFALPYFLDLHGISVPRMGVIYAAAAMLLFVVRVYAGHLSDRLGRKALYAISVLSSGAVSAATPASVALWFQTALKSVRDAGATVFDSMYQLALHDESRDRYVDRVGKARGLQSLAEAMATFGAGLLLAREAYVGSFRLSAAFLLAGFLVFLFGYRPNASPVQQQADQSLRGILAFDLPRPLTVLTASAFVFTIGLSASHCFVMQLFWERQFGASKPVIGTILMLHRFTIALPLLLVGWAVKSHLKQVYIAFVMLEGLALALSGLLPRFLPATLIWLTHDLFGAGVWLPIQSALIQRHSREETRGRDVSKVFAIASLGWLFGPLLAGAVFERWYGGPFFLSGAIMILSAFVLFALKPEDTCGHE